MVRKSVVGEIELAILCRVLRRLSSKSPLETVGPLYDLVVGGMEGGTTSSSFSSVRMTVESL